MSLRKRKKYSRDIKCVFFPDELDHSVQKGGKDTALSVASTVKSWEKCGDSFLDTPVAKPKSSRRTFSAIRKLSQALALDPAVAEHDKEPVHIAWSDSDESEDETKEQNVLQVIPKKRSLKTKRSPFQSYTSALNLLTNNDEEPPVIDTDSDIIQSEEEVERDSVQQISDCSSNVSNETLEEAASNPTNPLELEISGYESDETSGRMTFSTMDSGEGRQRFVSQWIRSAQAILQTPQKATEKQSKTPEDSAKKRKKFQSGGLAERLHRLQCRQRSAISFWRHKSVSENATTVDRPGVLVLEVLEVQEECSLRLVRCEHYTPPTGGHHHSWAPSGERAPLLVLFNKETTAQLNPLPKDIIHIYPPWQSLSVEGVDYDIILNTHFSQKVSCSSELAITSFHGFTALKRTPYSLDKVFGLEAYTAEEHNNKLDIHHAIGDSMTTPGHCQSLLDAIEALGQAGSVGQTVEVVVQRVYSIPVPDSCSGSILKHRIRSSTTPPAAENRTRLCVLVQDSYGMFSVVQLHLLASKDDLQRYCQMWQGRTCQLKAIKVVQRVTRERHARLFGLIDSLWPPLVPLKHHGSTASLQNENRVVGPPPSFYYLLCGQETSVETSEDQSVSPLYFPPAMQTLKELMQSEQKSCRCSFVAVVLYSKKQKANVGHDEIWLAITDRSLQAEQLEGLLRRTVTVCVSSSCVLASSVLEALNQPSACHVSFRDVIKEHGMFLCAEQSVIELCPLTTESSVQSSLGPLDKPVRLDALDLGVTPSSLCTVSGVIVGVDENTAYSWPSCSHCGSDHLEMLAHQRFHCVSCESILDKPETKVQLEVILSESSLKDWTIKIKLQKETILSLLNISTLWGGEFPGYDVVSVLGQELGPLNAYVRLITRKPSLWIGLEEISL